MNNILVTGGAGYIGSHIVYDLIDYGYNVTILDNLSTGFENNINSNAEFIKGDINNKTLLDKILKNIDTVIHLAAFKDANESMIYPSKYLENNILGSMILIDSCTKNKVKNFIFSSTAAVYGNPKYLPIDEKHILEPINYYGYTKLIIEQNLLWLNKISNLNIACLRYFNAAGYDLKNRVKCVEYKPSNLLPVVMEVCSGLKKEMNVYGTNYNTPDGTCLRDYIHVNDLSSAHIKSIDYLNRNNSKLILNLATGKSYSVFEVIKQAQIITSKKINFNIVDKRAGDPEKIFAKSINAKKLLNWEAEFSDIETIIKSMWKVYRDL